jgi:hypothetical protein
MPDLRTHARGPWWVEELPRSHVTRLTGSPLHGRHGIVLPTSKRGRATSSLIRCAASHTKGNTPTRPSMAGGPCASSIVALRSRATLHELRKGLR